MRMPLKRRITRKCTNLDIPLVGFASVENWDNPPFEPWVPEEFRPKEIYPEAKTVIVIGMPVSLPILETAPSIYYHELYRTVNSLLDLNGYRIASFLTAEGFPSIWVPRDEYGDISILKKKPLVFFSHRHAAYLAGLGNFGVNNMILTKEFGPRVRFASIFTTADIAPSKVQKDQLCIRCMRCREICPVHALNGKDYPDGLTYKETCAMRSEMLSKRFISPCGFCIKVCPIGEDREQFQREDMKIYNEEDVRYEQLHRAWHHVRSYGGI